MTIKAAPLLDRLHEANLRVEDASKVTIPAQKTLTHQILSLWHPFRDLKQTFAVSRRAEQHRLHTHQRVVATVEDSALRVKMGALESQKENAPKRICVTSQWVFSGSSDYIAGMRPGM